MLRIYVIQVVALVVTLLCMTSSNHAAAAVRADANTVDCGLSDAAKARSKLYFGTATEPSIFL